MNEINLPKVPGPFLQKGAWHLVFFLIFVSCLIPSAHAMSRRPKAFPIQLTVDFGPANKKIYDETIYVERDMSANEAVSQVFAIRTGAVCCSLRDVYEIDGVAIDTDKKRWWYCLRNGSKDFSPSHDKLYPNDHIEWKYIETPPKAKI